MTKAEAWLQCSARGTTVTRLAYIMGFNPSCAEGRTGGGIHKSTEREEPRNPLGYLGSKLGVPSSPL